VKTVTPKVEILTINDKIVEQVVVFINLDVCINAEYNDCLSAKILKNRTLKQLLKCAIVFYLFIYLFIYLFSKVRVNKNTTSKY